MFVKGKLMREFVKPLAVASRCIGFEPVRWDGKIIPCKIIEDFKPFVNFLPVCPEVEIGLGIPREPIRVVKKNGQRKLLQPATQKDFTKKMQQFIKKFLSELPEIDGVILKSRSPSCGI
ncbi:MAG: DUF523 domain-containing protein, partial [Crenarchaeota archaeon]|nr:DUF523 domain-containing protein [Thermoproteota archaeon]